MVPKNWPLSRQEPRTRAVRGRAQRAQPSRRRALRPGQSLAAGPNFGVRAGCRRSEAGLACCCSPTAGSRLALLADAREAAPRPRPAPLRGRHDGNRWTGMAPPASGARRGWGCGGAGVPPKPPIRPPKRAKGVGRPPRRPQAATLRPDAYHGVASRRVVSRVMAGVPGPARPGSVLDALRGASFGAALRDHAARASSPRAAPLALRPNRPDHGRPAFFRALTGSIFRGRSFLAVPGSRRPPWRAAAPCTP